MMRWSARRFASGGLALTALLVLGGCQDELYSALPQQDANEMLALLMKNGLGASKSLAKDGTASILIDERQFATAVELLRARGYPRAKFSTINDVFQPSGLIASPVQEQARFIWALGQELSKTVSQIDGVLTARVQVVLPDNDILKREPTPSSASVFVRYDDSSRIPGLVPQIKMLVANSVQGLSYDKVSVVLVPVAHIDAPAQVTEKTTDWRLPSLIGGGAMAIMGSLLLGFRSGLRSLLAQIKPTLLEATK
jgi:type III secretion protein J